MLSDDISCSDCKLEVIEKIWTTLLLDWLNKCVSDGTKVKKLDSKILLKVVNRYKRDICPNDEDQEILNNENLEEFLKSKYPILRLRFFTEDGDMTKKIYIMMSVLLFHCCCNSHIGEVDMDIRRYLNIHEQELILKFCENLSDMEVTVNNVDCAIKDAFEEVMNNNNLMLKSKEGAEETPSVIESMISDLSTKLSIDESSETTISNDVSTMKLPILKFKSSMTLVPSAVDDTSTFSDLISESNFEKSISSDLAEMEVFEPQKLSVYTMKPIQEMDEDSSEFRRRCKPECACTRCSASGPCCGDPGSSTKQCDQICFRQYKLGIAQFNWKVYAIIFSVVILLILIAVLSIIPFLSSHKEKRNLKNVKRLMEEIRIYRPNSWHCVRNMCQRVYQPTSNTIYLSHSRCTLICMGPQLWPYPIGYTYFSKTIVALATNKLEYRLLSVPSEIVHQHVAIAFKLFIEDLARLETIGLEYKNKSKDITPKRTYIQIDVESDPEPRLRLNTEEAYTLKIDIIANNIIIKIASASFCGVRHGLETISQLILLDQDTGYLITISSAVIRDAPSYKYRGLMIDTGRNYIPVSDLMRTVDAMAMSKLNTLHWRISDVASFPLLLEKIPQLFEYGGYSRNMVYTKEDVRALVKRAIVRGIRILMEVASPGPVGRAWSWLPEATCPTKNANHTCDNALCLRLPMTDTIFDILQIIYEEIIEMTNVDDIFHLSDGMFSLTNCYNMIEHRVGFLDKALERLKIANKGFLPKLPIVWFTSHLSRDYEANTWEGLGVQLHEWHPGPSNQFLRKFKVIHSSKWDLSCEVHKQRCKKYRTWQEMYAWKSWRNIEVFTVEGGEAVLWTDLVNSANLDNHLWPRASAVAERLWSDTVVNASATPGVYIRLDHHRWRMLLKSVKVQPVWPVWCSFNPGTCLEKLKSK